MFSGVTYASVEEAVREAQLEKGELVEEKRTKESNTLMDPNTVEYISGWIEKKDHRIKCMNQLDVETKRQRDFMKDGHLIDVELLDSSC